MYSECSSGCRCEAVGSMSNGNVKDQLKLQFYSKGYSKADGRELKELNDLEGKCQTRVRTLHKKLDHAKDALKNHLNLMSKLSYCEDDEDTVAESCNVLRNAVQVARNLDIRVNYFYSKLTKKLSIIIGVQRREIVLLKQKYVSQCLALERLLVERDKRKAANDKDAPEERLLTSKAKLE